MAAATSSTEKTNDTLDDGETNKLFRSRWNQRLLEIEIWIVDDKKKV